MGRWHTPDSLLAGLLSCHQFQGATGSWSPSGWSFCNRKSASPAHRKPRVGNGASDHWAVVKPISMAPGNHTLVNCDAEAGGPGTCKHHGQKAFMGPPSLLLSAFCKHPPPHILLAALSFEHALLRSFQGLCRFLCKQENHHLEVTKPLSFYFLKRRREQCFLYCL